MVCLRWDAWSRYPCLHLEGLVSAWRVMVWPLAQNPEIA